MKVFLLTLASALMLISCHTDNKNKAALTQPADTLMEPELYTELYGNYIGNFETDESRMAEGEEWTEPAKINIMITRITKDRVEGRSIVKGNERPMTGKITRSGSKSTFVMDEPGDNKYDGRFEFSIEGDSLSGTWVAYNQADVQNPFKKFALSKKPFQYSAHLMLPRDWEYIDYQNPKEKREIYKNEDGTIDTFVNEVFRSASDQVYVLNASKDKLSEAQLKNLRKLDLEIIRNTIFARHGYSFKKKSIRQFFDQVEWYIPVSNNVDAALTPLEKENIALLQRFEKYAEDNYDTFGR